MKWLTCALVVSAFGCASATTSPARSTSPVEVPTWAEGTQSAAPSKSIAATQPSTVSLGSDATKPIFRGKRIDLDLVGADLPNVCRLIGELAGVNVVVGDGVSGTVTVQMKNVPWEDALDAILLSKGYVKERVGSVIVVRAH